MTTIQINDIENIHEAAREFIHQIGDARVFAFYGKMGAGKTTFIKAICEELGCQDVITSPTFAIVNEYFTAEGEPVYHFDFYRIDSIDEAVKIGFDDYLYSGDYCFIEWTEKVEEMLPDDCVRVDIKVLEDGRREFIY